MKTERIRVFCDILCEIWEARPDYRFGQMLCQAFGIRSSTAGKYGAVLYHIIDDDLLYRVLRHHPPYTLDIESSTYQPNEQKYSELLHKIMDLELYEDEDWRLDPEHTDEWSDYYRMIRMG